MYFPLFRVAGRRNHRASNERARVRGHVTAGVSSCQKCCPLSKEKRVGWLINRMLMIGLTMAGCSSSRLTSRLVLTL